MSCPLRPAWEYLTDHVAPRDQAALPRTPINPATNRPSTPVRPNSFQPGPPNPQIPAYYIPPSGIPAAGKKFARCTQCDLWRQVLLGVREESYTCMVCGLDDIETMAAKKREDAEKIWRRFGLGEGRGKDKGESVAVERSNAAVKGSETEMDTLESKRERLGL